MYFIFLRLNFMTNFLGTADLCQHRFVSETCYCVIRYLTNMTTYIIWILDALICLYFIVYLLY